jgi:hypothetical protein
MMLAPRLDAAGAKAKFDSGEAVALDVTSSLVYPSISRRIPGSVRIAPEPIVRALQRARPASEILGLLESLPPDKQVVAYCT